MIDLESYWQDLGHVPCPEPLAFRGVRSPTDAWPVLGEGGRVQGYVPRPGVVPRAWLDVRIDPAFYRQIEELQAQVENALRAAFLDRAALRAEPWIDPGIPKEGER